MSMTQRSVITSVIAAGAAFALLTGCAPEPATTKPSAAPTSVPATASTTPPPATPIDETEPSAGPILIPDCEEILPITTARDAVGSQTLESFEPSAEHKELAYSESFGPVAIEALESAEQLVQCSWGYPVSDGVATVFIAKLSPATREHLVSSLRDSVFLEREADNALIFEDHDPQRRKSMPVSYGLIGDVWVTHIGTLPLFEPILRGAIAVGLNQA